jgi:hypothetical protein
MSLFEEASLVITPNGFKAGKLYAVKGADLDVSRATSATRVNANGIIETVGANVPRIDYTGGGCPSILVEPQRTNLQTYSEDFSNAVYTKIGTTISSNVTVSPDGNTTADKLVENTLVSLHELYISAGQIIGGNYTFSVFVKSGGRTKFALSEAFSIGGFVIFDLTAETATTNAPALNGKIENYGNGWFRCSATWNFLPVTTTILYLNLLNDSGNNNYLGDGTSGVNLWGAQLESGSYATSYIPTTSASVTRNADVITLTPTTGLTEIKETFEDNTTNVITTIPSTYTMSQGRIKNVVMK